MRADDLSLPYAAAGLSDEAAAAHALNRLAFGPRPGEAAAVAAAGLEGWVAAQLGPPGPDPALDRRLRRLGFLGRPLGELLETYLTDPKALALAVERGAFPRGTTIVDRGVRAPLRDWMRENGYASHPRLRNELVEAKLARAVHAEAQLHEVLADLWYNHFNVDARGPAVVLAAAYEGEAIRPHLWRRFRTLLGATARHPAMLTYLTNTSSRATAGTPVTGGRAPARGGLNENYGRELLELHTVGVDGGYTEADVLAAARAFTGWTVFPYGATEERRARLTEALDRFADRGIPVVRDGLFLFRPNWHDAEPKTVMGLRMPAGRGIEDGEELLDHLAGHPATARHIARRLAVRFVADDPEAGLVDRLAAAYRRTDGDLQAVLAALVQDPAFWAAARGGPDGAPSKVKTPFEFVVSAARATAAPLQEIRDLAPALRAMGEPVYHAQPPTGFPDHAEAWVNPGLLLSRMALGLQLAAGRVSGVVPDLDALTGGRQPESVEAALETYARALLPGRDIGPTVRLLRPIVREPAFARRVADAAEQNPAPALDDDDVFAGAAPAPFDADDTAAFVVGVVLGSPSFQRQ